MRVPEAMKKLIRHFHQDVFLIEETLDGVVDYGIRSLTHSEVAEVRSFLVTLLDGSYGLDQISAIWRSLPKDIRIDDDQEIANFLRHIRDKLVNA